MIYHDGWPCDNCLYVNYMKPKQPMVKTVVMLDKTVYKENCCSKCFSKFNYIEVSNKVKFCPNCGQKQDWSGLCDK